MPRPYDASKASAAQRRLRRGKKRVPKGFSTAAREERAGGGTARGRGVECPTPWKLAYPTQASAEQFLKYAHYEGRTVRPHRAYLCGCGAWHTSSKE